MAHDYSCADFACDAWTMITGSDALRPVLADLLRPAGSRTARPALRHSFARSPTAVSPCVVLLRRGSGDSHVGIHDRGLILHLTRTGARRQPPHLAFLGYRTPRFYALRPADH